MKALVTGFALIVFAIALRAEAIDTTLRVVAVDGSVTNFSLSDLAAMPQTTVTTATAYSDGRPAFRGPLARDVLRAAAASGGEVAVVTARDGFQATIPLEDFDEYGVIFALTMDGRALSARGKGPIWVMYPVDQHPRLSGPPFKRRLVWQLAEVVIR